MILKNMFKLDNIYIMESFVNFNFRNQLNKPYL